MAEPGCTEISVYSSCPVGLYRLTVFSMLHGTASEPTLLSEMSRGAKPTADGGRGGVDAGAEAYKKWLLHSGLMSACMTEEVKQVCVKGTRSSYHCCLVR